MRNVLYHGTTMEFYNRQTKLYGYYYGFNRIYLTENLWHAVFIAESRAEDYKASPLLLIINSHKIEKRIKIYGISLITMDHLNPDEIILLDNLPNIHSDKETNEFRQRIEKFAIDYF